jgi:hypothetical protein
MTDHKTTQADKFKEAARELGADEDEARWEERLRKVAKQKPSEEDETAAG